jgi:hypothetical protein
MNRTNDPSHRATSGLGKWVGLSVAVAVAAWCVGYLYLVKVVGYPAAGFFTFKMLTGLLLLSFTLCSIFWLRFDLGDSSGACNVPTLRTEFFRTLLERKHR